MGRHVGGDARRGKHEKTQPLQSHLRAERDAGPRLLFQALCPDICLSIYAGELMRLHIGKKRKKEGSIWLDRDR
ncbi:MAG: hypothetical protein ABI810_14725 [Sphingomonas bacterium]